MSERPLPIAMDRDSVHPGDDGESHAMVFRAKADQSVLALVQAIRQLPWLPRISGGAAVWVIESSADGGGPIGVLAQQWAAPRLVVSPEMSVAEHFGAHPPTLHFRYRGQEDAARAFAALLDSARTCGIKARSSRAV